VRTAAAAALLLTTLAAPAPAQTEAPPMAGADRIALFVDAVRTNGCSMTDAEADARLPAAGLTVPEVIDAVSLLHGVDGAAFSDSGALVLSRDWCEGTDSLAMVTAALEQMARIDPWTPAFTQAEGAALVGAVRDNGCTMTEEQAGATLPQLGLTVAITRDVVEVMLDAGLAGIAPDGTLMLAPALCEGAAANDADTVWAARAALMERVTP
jgi:hypothetical protein